MAKMLKTQKNWSNFISFFIKSILAGLMIGMAGFAYIQIENKLMGAFLFSLGLLTIVIKEFNLYTGKIYTLTNSTKDVFNKGAMLLGNFIGSFVIVGGLVRFCTPCNSDSLWASKLLNSYGAIFILSMFCGILMYLAVSLYKTKQNPLYIIMPIMFFILAKCEHCVANMFYLAISSSITIKHWNYLFINIIGNSLGSIIFYRLEQLSVLGGHNND